MSWTPNWDALASTDPEIAQVLIDELDRQRSKLQMIASENFASPAVLVAQGSVLTNKYAEGYPGKRYYGGLRVRGRGRESGSRSGKGPVRSRTRERPAARGRTGQHGRLPRAGSRTWRHGDGHVTGARGSLDPRLKGQLLGQMVRHRGIRRPRGHRTAGLRRPGPYRA